MSRKKKTTAQDHSPAAPKRSRRRAYRVKLPFGPSSVIERCTSPEEAYERYRRAHGIIASDHDPLIKPILRGER